MTETTHLVQDFLTENRTVPPERDGWFTGFEILRGLQQRGQETLGTQDVYDAIDHLMQTVPPVIEFDWLVIGDASRPPRSIVGEVLSAHEHVHRHYRLLQDAVELIPS
ncbi:hypothetical protein KDA23_06550 [Candidatus Saccharibacteria bacterium]|nr:hypothetical protein [Candidatus Saccharibacteria bacterium]